MRNLIIPITLFAACVLPFSGCNSNDYTLAPVTGTATYNGKPIPKLSVVFSPQPIGENHAVGPFSTGVTDAEGKFTLKTRHGKDGALVGKHTVAFEYTDIGETAMGDLRDELADAKDEQSKEDFEEVKKKIANMKAKLKGRPVLDRLYKGTIDIPAGGSENLKLELTEMGGN
jgi:hypothetical protein